MSCSAVTLTSRADVVAQFEDVMSVLQHKKRVSSERGIDEGERKAVPGASPCRPP